ncbi:MAG TPA: glycosyltransferase [Thermoanaerobaculia bacterium]|jgi:cellulose synthase/poly-beta-1,6-N-acetylglucosamine synthase-like glycosyltransferase
MSIAEAAVLTLYYAVLGVLTVYSVHRFHLVRLRRRSPEPQRARGDVFPPLTIQLPLYNEPNVAARLLDAVAAIDYPGALDIQVLDDSTDATTAIVAERVAAIRARGVRIAHLRRGSRDGYKAGALAYGMSCSDAELFAVFDADFVPPRDVLLRMVPYFADARAGMVQARWTHLNRERSLLTRVQALYLDAHFAVESAARNFGGRFFNFNGTAGVWRRAAIEEAGGWSSSTLTEDLDLSYRAQLAGWSFIFLPEVEVPAELPAALSGFQEQQHRWAKGSIQTARKLLGEVLRMRTTRAVKSEALFHLTNNCAYLLSVVLSLLIVPAMVIRYAHDLLWTFSIDLVLFVASSGSVLLFYREGQRWANRPRPRLREMAAVLPVGIGISMRNAAAVVEGFVARGGEFRRTPKAGARGDVAPDRTPRFPWSELLLALFFAAVIADFAGAGRWASLPFLTMFASGYGYVACRALIERVSYRSTAL